MRIIRRRTIVVVALAITIFTSTSSLLAGINSVPTAFAGGDWLVITDSSAPTIFSSQIDLDLMDALREVPNVTGASPEILTFSSWGDESFVVRGMGGGFGDIAWPEGTTGSQTPPGNTGRANATIGDGLLGRLGLALPCQLALAGSFNARMDIVTVMDHFSTDTPIDDELVVPISVARHLSAMPDGKVSIIRVVTTDPEWLSGVLSPTTARFVISDLALSAAEVAENQTMNATVSLRNWGRVLGSQSVFFSVDGDPRANITEQVNASSSKPVTAQLRLRGLGPHTIEARLDGSFPVKLSENVTVVEPFIRVSAPARIVSGGAFNVTVARYDGSPAVGAEVSFQGARAVLGVSGATWFTAGALGDFPVTASLSGFPNVSRTVRVLDPSVYPNEFLPSVSSFVLTPLSVKDSGKSYGTIVAENGGRVAGVLHVNVTVDSAVYVRVNITLQAMGTASRTFIVSGLDPGVHTVQVGNLSSELTVRAWYADRPDLVNFVIRHSGSSRLSASNAIPVFQAGKLSQANIAAILFAIGAISGLLSVLTITSAFSVDVRRSRRAFGISRTLGASNMDLRTMVFPQALWTGLAGGAIGIVLGLLVAVRLSGSEAFSVLAHRLVLEVDLWLVGLILAGTVAIGVVSALVSAGTAARESPTVSMRGLREKEEQQVDEALLLGDE